MKQYRHILVPIDFSKQSYSTLEAAIAIQQKNQSSLTIINYVEPLPATCYGEMVTQIEEGMEKTALKQMAKFADRFHIDIANTRVEIAQPKTAIPQLAKQLAIDLIVIGKHNHQRLLGNLLSRSTTCQVAYHSPCDVYIVNSDRG